MLKIKFTFKPEISFLKIFSEPQSLKHVKILMALLGYYEKHAFSHMVHLAKTAFLLSFSDQGTSVTSSLPSAMNHDAVERSLDIVTKLSKILKLSKLLWNNRNNWKSKGHQNIEQLIEFVVFLLHLVHLVYKGSKLWNSNRNNHFLISSFIVSCTTA